MTIPLTCPTRYLDAHSFLGYWATSSATGPSSLLSKIWPDFLDDDTGAKFRLALD